LSDGKNEGLKANIVIFFLAWILSDLEIQKTIVIFGFNVPTGLIALLVFLALDVLVKSIKKAEEILFKYFASKLKPYL
jgi:uncharacterized PurR-regulated membrane protein YhhQ (DUF165 family)